jgi:hypothetical protein
MRCCRPSSPFAWRSVAHDLSPGNRYARDRRHRSPPPAAGDPSERRPAALTNLERSTRSAHRVRPLSPGSRSSPGPRESATDRVRLQHRPDRSLHRRPGRRLVDCCCSIWGLLVPRVWLTCAPLGRLMRTAGIHGGNRSANRAHDLARAGGRLAGQLGLRFRTRPRTGEPVGPAHHAPHAQRAT